MTKHILKALSNFSALKLEQNFFVSGNLSLNKQFKSYAKPKEAEVDEKNKNFF